MKGKLKAVFCALFGHSRIQEVYFGYFYCARCGAQIGDSLGGMYDASKSVLDGCGCDTCRENYKKLTWRDKMFCPIRLRRGRNER